MRIIFPKFYALIEEEEERKNRPQNFVSHLLFAGHERLAVQLLVSSRRKVTSFESVSERGHVDLRFRQRKCPFFMKVPLVVTFKDVIFLQKHNSLLACSIIIIIIKKSLSLSPRYAN